MSRIGGRRAKRRVAREGYSGRGGIRRARRKAAQWRKLWVTYENPHRGPRAADAGAHGVLVVDLPLGADPEREAWFGNGPLEYIRLVAPTTPQERMSAIAQTGGGFVYLVSRLGVTGERNELPADLPDTIARVRAATDLPLCVGFGISRPEQARAVAQLADGVVVGSAIVRAADESVEAAVALATALRRGIDGV
jgi:tryptophan synthase alpha chain